MSRMRTFVAFTTLAACMCLGIGTAAPAKTAAVAGNSGTIAGDQSHRSRTAVDLYY